jgi:hypothetical protein
MERATGWVVACCLVFVSLLLSWQALAKLDFLYSVWHPALNIEEHIRHYAVRNKTGRQNFVLTTPAEHHRLFGALVQGIHGRGEPLDQVVYRNADGEVLGTFLHADEVGHLGDVAVLVQRLLWAGWTITAVAVFLVLLQGRRGIWLPAFSRVMMGYGIVLVAGGVVIALVGPKQAFDGLHEWIFASGHPWFFYYQESLMTTVMKAPDIFAAIASVWIALHLLLFVLLLAALRYLVKRPGDRTA